MKSAPKTQLNSKAAKPWLRPACRHVTKAGRRCHFPAIADSLYCLNHIARHDAEIVAIHEPNPDGDLTPHFPEPRTLEFKSACDIHDFLSGLAGILVRNRVSTRRASVLAYIASLQLRILPAVDHELNSEAIDSDELPRFGFTLSEMSPVTPSVPENANPARNTESDAPPSATVLQHGAASATPVPSPS